MGIAHTIDTNTIEGIRNELSTSKRILITTHRSPDGDAIGSSLGLYQYLVSQGHDVIVSVPDPFPAFLNWLPEVDKLLIYKLEKQKFEEELSNVDILFALDYNHFSRTGDELGKLLSASTATKIMIDHHQEPDDFMKYKVWDIQASSTAELLYDLIVNLSGEEAITKEIGECLYTGIMTDTGSFRFKSCSSHTMGIAAHLLEIGVNGDQIHQLVYDQNSIDRLHLMGYALEKMVLLKEYYTAYISLSREELERFNYQPGDTEGLVNKALSVKGVKVAALISEKEGGIRFSFRSSADFSVNDFARSHFNGGGHFHAAGGSYKGSINDACDLFVEKLKAYKHELESA